MVDGVGSAISLWDGQTCARCLSSQCAGSLANGGESLAPRRENLDFPWFIRQEAGHGFGQGELRAGPPLYFLCGLGDC